MTDSETSKAGSGSAAELLGDWRAADRDLSAAKETASEAALAAAAADVAKVAATETGDAARISADAAQRAEASARRTAEAADISAKAARRESIDADGALARSTSAEADAGERFHEAQDRGFPKR